MMGDATTFQRLISLGQSSALAPLRLDCILTKLQGHWFRLEPLTSP